MINVRMAYRSYAAAERCLLWAIVEMLTGAIAFRKKASAELVALNPKSPQQLYDSGYALFYYDITCDDWKGHWRSANTQRHAYYSPLFMIEDISKAPGHRITFADGRYTNGFNVFAVDLEYAKANLLIEGSA